MVREAAQCEDLGAIGALLRREGLYSSLLSKWRRQAAAGELQGLTSRKRGPKPKLVDARDRRIAELERELRKSRQRAELAETLVAVQKKLSEVLGLELPAASESRR
jgi:transposase-like protein